MRILVTGGAGFIGSTFVHRRLAATDDSVIVVDKLTYAGNPANLAGLADDPATRDRYRFVHADIADAARMKELAGECDAIVNFAAESHVDRSILEPTAFLHTGVMGVYALLEAALEQSRQRDGAFRLLQVSTDEVYGPVPEGLSVESDPIRPTSPYSAAKAAGEHLVAAYHETHGLDTVITRGANTYGPSQYPEKLIPLVRDQCARRRALAHVRRWHAASRLALRGRSCRRHRRGARAGRGGRGLQRAAAMGSSDPTVRSRRPSCSTWASPGRWCAPCPTGLATTVATRSTGRACATSAGSPRTRLRGRHRADRRLVRGQSRLVGAHQERRLGRLLPAAVRLAPGAVERRLRPNA